MLRNAFGQIRPNLRTIAPEGESGSTEGGEQTGTEGTQSGGEQAQQGQQSGEPQDVASLPDFAQKMIRDLRAEAANHRTKATTAAQDAEKSLTDKLATALGLKPEAAADPAALTQQLTTAQKSAKDAAIQLAIYRAAGQHQGNPDALLDSNTFLANVSALDPTSAEFPTQVSDAIKAAVTQNPNLKLAQAAGPSAADHAGGSGEVGAITEQQLAGASAEQIDAWHRAGRLDHLL